jgi:hypothetical protein
VPQKITTALQKAEKVKTCGKSARVAIAIGQPGKPYGLKAHVYLRMKAARLIFPSGEIRKGVGC